MVELKPSITSNLVPSFTAKPPLQVAESSLSSALRSVTTPEGVHISGEAQYLMEMDFYLQTLDKDEQDKALHFLSISDDPLQVEAVESFSELQKTKISAEMQKSMNEARELLMATGPKAMDRDPLAGPEIAVIPAATHVFRLDGKTDFNPVQLNTSNTKIKAQLDNLESSIPPDFNIQDKANLIGTVRNALYASESIQLSFDDVLNFNYMFEKAHTTIAQTDAPNNFKTKLKDILDQAVTYQNIKQSEFLVDAEKYINNSFVGAVARENIRLGTAAQAYNNELQGVLKVTNLSVLAARPVMANLLSRHTDLIRFGQEKINEALSFYQQDFAAYQDFVKNGYTPPTPNEIVFDASPLAEGHSYALKVIDEIQNYVSKRKTV